MATIRPVRQRASVAGRIGSSERSGFRLLAFAAVTAIAAAACVGGGQGGSGGDASGPAAASPAAMGRPANLVATPRRTSVRLSWEAPETGPAPVSYEVYRDQKPERLVTSTSLVVRRLVPGTPYDFQVRALGQAGASEPAGLDVRTRPGTLSSARVDGSYYVTLTITSLAGLVPLPGSTGPAAGDHFSEFWEMYPRCHHHRCSVRLQTNRDAQGTLRPTGTSLAGTLTGLPLIGCQGSKADSTMAVTLKVTGARSSGTEWQARRFAGSISEQNPPGGLCAESTGVDFTFAGSLD